MNKEVEAGYINVTLEEWGKMKHLGFKTKVKEIEEAKQELLTLLEEKVKGMDSFEFAPPENCTREVCTSCPEMKGRVNGYERAKDEILSTIEELKK